MEYQIITKAALDGKVWRVVMAGRQYVSRHKTIKAARLAVNSYKINPPLLGYVM